MPAGAVQDGALQGSAVQSGAFADLALSHDAGTTRISGTVTDQAELQGVLSQLFNLGLEILSISTHPGEIPHG